ncbi:MAG: dihydroorotase [Myxococcales bacterium]|nr:dihydroorotase [Myxococcales bacterium]
MLLTAAPTNLPALLIAGARIYDPARGLSDPIDVRVRQGHIAEIGADLPDDGCEVVAAVGQVLCAGFVDLLACAREPGDEHEEDLCSLSDAAAAGGYVAVVVGPDTRPSNDDHAVTELILRRAREYGRCEVLPQGALSHRLQGQQLAPIGEMAEAGAVCFGDADRPVTSARLMRRALEYARSFHRPIFSHPMDPSLGGVMHEGAWSTRLGLRGSPAAAEAIIVARDLMLAQLARAQLHFIRLTTRRSVELVREARRHGVAVTASVTPWHLTYTAEALRTYDPNLKFSQPLRDEADRLALLEGLRDGTIDAVCSDHAPENVADKCVEFDAAEPGAIGLQTVWPVLMDRVRAAELTLEQALHALVEAPRRVLSLPSASVSVGRAASLALLDLDATWRLDAATSRSRSRNTVLWGRELRGRAVLTLLRGRIVHRVLAD